MAEYFDNREEEYLNWVNTHQDTGYVVNVDDPQKFKNYPMVHLAKHKLIWGPSRTNYTTGRYKKYCSTDLKELESWSLTIHKKELTFCKACFNK
ncbi:hypothetical protein [Thalassomonas sp. RHCl1]|uniref:hypothetical protein n=1 Tax=Thalassomonas sp. RHCl1 TaxID=2995320 RepID=UPI00248BBC57|nr:hypothetical protein [Thalassomonas sp. RHCl1]